MSFSSFFSFSSSFSPSSAAAAALKLGLYGVLDGFLLLLLISPRNKNKISGRLRWIMDDDDDDGFGVKEEEEEEEIKKKC